MTYTSMECTFMLHGGVVRPCCSSYDKAFCRGTEAAHPRPPFALEALIPCLVWPSAPLPCPRTVVCC